MVRYITDSDYPHVLRIWQACFGDEESYVRFFWDNCFPLCRGLFLEADGRPVSMLFLLPGCLSYKNARLPAEYVYAVATEPEHRGRGYAAQLTRFAAKIAEGEKKSALCLCPATEQLYAYYAKQGFRYAFARRDTGFGRFAYAPPMLDYMKKEQALTARVIAQSDEPGGMLLPLDERSSQWLDETQGKAYMEYTLE